MPKSSTPDGTSWRCRVESATGRRCDLPNGHGGNHHVRFSQFEDFTDDGTVVSQYSYVNGSLAVKKGTVTCAEAP